MRALFLKALSCTIALSVLLASAVALILWTGWLDGVQNPLNHALAAVAELAIGVAVLLGALYVATHAAVRMLSRSAGPAPSE